MAKLIEMVTIKGLEAEEGRLFLASERLKKRSFNLWSEAETGDVSWVERRIVESEMLTKISAEVIYWNQCVNGAMEL